MGHCVRGLYEEGRHYDLLMSGPNDLPFYESQVKKYGEPVLELACGTGRLTIPLRLAGCRSSKLARHAESRAWRKVSNVVTRLQHGQLVVP